MCSHTLSLPAPLPSDGALASERDYQAYAEAAVQNGQYGEAKAIIEAGRAGGKLLSNGAATASIYKTASARVSQRHIHHAHHPAFAFNRGGKQPGIGNRSEEHTSELQSLMRRSY